METFSFDRKYPTKCSLGEVDVTPYEVELTRGIYKIQLWGASGGGLEQYAGYGGYAKGIIKVNESTKYYLYVGSSGTCEVYGNYYTPRGGCNGGGNAYIGHQEKLENDVCSGGGETDFRLNTSIDSRVLVAGGGGGSRRTNIGGYGGGEFGGKGDWDDISGRGGNQTHGGDPGVYGNIVAERGGKDIGGNGIGQAWSAGGSGAGYFGGGGSYETSGSGGSGFINTDIFTGKIMSGNTRFISPDGIYRIGNYGNGFAQITLLKNKLSCKLHRKVSLGVSAFIVLFIS